MTKSGKNSPQISVQNPCLTEVEDLAVLEENTHLSVGVVSIPSDISVSSSLRSSGKVLVNASRCAADVLVNALVHLRSLCLYMGSTFLVFNFVHQTG